MSKIVIEKKLVAKIALFSLLGSIPGAAAFSFVTQGDSVFWAQVERALGTLIPSAKASGTVDHTTPGTWTNNPNWSVVVTDCDCPGPLIISLSGTSIDITCFVAGTKVRMADGSEKNIEDVKIGEQVINSEGETNNVKDYERVPIGARGTFKINDKVEVTGDHPFLAADGSWKVCDLELFQKGGRNADLEVSQLVIGDILKTETGEEKVETLVHIYERPEAETVYDLKLDGNNTYISAGFVVHNCDGDDGTCFVAGTKVKMADRSEKNIEDVEIGEQVINSEGETNNVKDYERVPIGTRGTFKINDKVEVTGDHPFLAADGSWKVCDLELFQKNGRNADLEVSQLVIGDVLNTETGEEKVETLEHVFERPEEETVYDLKLDGNNTYISAGFVVHNCDDDDDSDDCA
jgi:intein/homing endonuclease